MKKRAPANFQMRWKDFTLFGLLFLLFNRYTHYVLSTILKHLFGGNFHWFVERWQLDSDMSVRLRLNSSLNEGLFSHFLSLGEYGNYLSQVGLGGWLLTLPVYLLHRIGILSYSDYSLPAPEMGISGSIGLFLLYSFVACLNASIIYLTAKWIGKCFSTTAMMLFLFAAISPWSLAIQSSLFWLVGLKLLPGFVIGYLFSREKFNLSRIFIALFMSTLLSYLSGYEFATLIFIGPISVVLYISITKGWDSKENFRYFATTILTSLLAFFTSLILHFLQLTLILGGLSSAKSQFMQVISKRTGITKENFGELYHQSLSSDPLGVLNTYLSMPIFGAPYRFTFLSNFTVLGFICFVFIIWLMIPNMNMPNELSAQYRALGAAWLISLLGPLGWFLLARPHSFGHTHIDFVLWFLPTIPIGAIFLAVPISLILNRIKFDRISRRIIYIFIAAFIFMLCESYLTVVG
jgi:hypothetical protein